MPSVLETTTAIQDKVLEGMQAGQKSMIDALRSWADIVETISGKLPEFPVPDYQAKPGEFLQTAFGFTEKLANSQRDFLSQAFEVTKPAMKTAAKTATDRATTAADKAAAKS